MSAYLETQSARERLADYEMTPAEELPTAGDLRAASAALDALAPFAGAKTDPAQEKEFPRNGEEVVPDEVLDWVALRAYQLSRDEEPPVKSEGAGRVSVTYLYGKLSSTERRMMHLLDEWLLWTGSRV